KGIQFRKIVHINNEIFIKTHQYGSTIVTSTKSHLDIKEFFVFKLVENLNIGSESHWYCHNDIKDSIYIATKGMSFNKTTVEKELVRLRKPSLLSKNFVFKNDFITNFNTFLNLTYT
ncbi:hypothetical protein HK099_001224, partial [Clydaea vesicula]